MLFVDNSFRLPLRGGRMSIVDPADESVITTQVPAATSEDVDLAVAAANKAFKTWGKTTGAQRAVVLRALAREIRTEKDTIATIESVNSGKAKPEAEWDVDDVAACFEYYAGLAEKLDEKQGTPVDVGDARFKASMYYDAVGVVGAIVPFNYPLLMCAWKCAAALAAGCTVVLKPSEYTPFSALFLANLTLRLKGEEALPSGAFNVITGTGADAGGPLTRHRDVSKITFTGSVATGSHIMSTCAKDIRKISLELGGKSAMILFDDLDDEAFARAVEWAMFGIFWTNGQICSATSRLLVHEKIAPRFLAALKAAAEEIKIGHPLTPDVKLGPVVSKQQYEKVMKYIREGVSQGATLLTGGSRPAEFEKGYFVQPTIFVDVKPHMSIWREEIFGPVLSVRTFSTEEQAVAEANDSDFGLAASVLSSCPARVARITRAMRTGIVWNNCAQPCFVQLPWGGPKLSGVGRDNGEIGFSGYLEPKQVVEWVTKDRLGWYNLPSKL